MKLVPTLAVFALAVAVSAADDTKKGDKELKMPALDAKEWKEVKGKEGLKTWDVKEGKGDEVQAGATVKFHYTGWLKDGTIFDSSVQRGEPIEYPLGELIKGWQEAMPGMKVGGVRRLYIPYALGYGEKGKGKIPGKADLVFEVEVLATK